MRVRVLEVEARTAEGVLGVRGGWLPPAMFVLEIAEGILCLIGVLRGGGVVATMVAVVRVAGEGTAALEASSCADAVAGPLIVVLPFAVVEPITVPEADFVVRWR